jgi:hypothetical protein
MFAVVGDVRSQNEEAPRGMSTPSTNGKGFIINVFIYNHNAAFLKLVSNGGAIESRDLVSASLKPHSVLYLRVNHSPMILVEISKPFKEVDGLSMGEPAQRRKDQKRTIPGLRGDGLMKEADTVTWSRHASSR